MLARSAVVICHGEAVISVKMAIGKMTTVLMALRWCVAIPAMAQAMKSGVESAAGTMFINIL
jgi:hypothetical protein